MGTLGRVTANYKGEVPIIRDSLITALGPRGDVALRAFPILGQAVMEQQGLADMDMDKLRFVVWKFEGGTWDEIADHVPGDIIQQERQEHTNSIHVAGRKMVFPIHWLRNKSGPDWFGKGVLQIAEGFSRTFSNWALREMVQCAALGADRRQSAFLKFSRDETYRWLASHFGRVFCLQKEGSGFPRVEADMLRNLEARGVRGADIMIATNGSVAHLIDLPIRRHGMEADPIVLSEGLPRVDNIVKGKSRRGLFVFESQGGHRDPMAGNYEFGEMFYSLGDVKSDPSSQLSYTSGTRNICGVPDYQDHQKGEIHVRDMLRNCGIWDPVTGRLTPYGPSILKTLIGYSRDTKRVMPLSRIPFLKRIAGADDGFDDDKSNDHEFLTLYNLCRSAGENVLEAIVAKLVRIDQEKYEHFRFLARKRSSSRPGSGGDGDGDDDDDDDDASSAAELAKAAFRAMSHDSKMKRGRDGLDNSFMPKRSRVQEGSSISVGDDQDLKLLYGGETDDVLFDSQEPLYYQPDAVMKDGKLPPSPEKEGHQGKYKQPLRFIGPNAMEYRKYLRALRTLEKSMLTELGKVVSDSKMARARAVDRFVEGFKYLVRRQREIQWPKADNGIVKETAVFAQMLELTQFSKTDAKGDPRTHALKILEEVRADNDFIGAALDAGHHGNRPGPVEEADIPADEAFIDSAIRLIIRPGTFVTLCQPAREKNAQRPLARLARCYATLVIQGEPYDRRTKEIIRAIFIKILEHPHAFATFHDAYRAVEFDDPHATRRIIDDLIGNAREYLSAEAFREISAMIEKHPIAHVAGGGGGGPPGGGDDCRPIHRRHPIRDREGVLADLAAMPLDKLDVLEWFVTENIQLPIGFICARNVSVDAASVMAAKSGPDTAVNLIMSPAAMMDLDPDHRNVSISFYAKSATAVISPENLEFQPYTMALGNLRGGGLNVFRMTKENIERFAAHGFERADGDIIVIPVPMGFRPDRDIMDICGQFHHEMTARSADEPWLYPTAHDITRMLNLRHVDGLYHASNRFFFDNRAGRNTVYSVGTHVQHVLGISSDPPTYREVLVEGRGPMGLIETAEQMKQLVGGGKFQNIMSGSIPHRSVIGDRKSVV